MSKAESVFREELVMIRNPEIRAFVLRVFDTMAPDYFWTVPASTSGKYHPDISLGVGGLVRHTKLAVWWAVELSRIEIPRTGDAGFMDEVIAALLLHDLLKNGDTLSPFGKPTLDNATAIHGVYLSEQIRIRVFPPGTSPNDWQHRIMHAIGTHMGRWTAEGYGQPDTDVDVLVHLADYCASRKVDAAVARIMPAIGGVL
jgi:hypothetical protein